MAKKGDCQIASYHTVEKLTTYSISHMGVSSLSKWSRARLQEQDMPIGSLWYQEQREYMEIQCECMKMIWLYSKVRAKPRKN